MTLAAAGGYSVTLQKCKKALGQCSSWQTWTGHVADESAASAHIAEYEKLWTEAEVAAGRAVRAMVALEGMVLIPMTSVWRGVVVVHFEAPVSAEYLADPEQAWREFNNNCAQVVAEMIADARADVTGTLAALREDGMVPDGPYRTPEAQRESDGDVIWMDWRIPVGLK